MNRRIKRPKARTNLVISGDLVDDAKALGINLSEAAERGVAEAVRAEKTRRWKEENAERFEAWNDYAEEHGLPLAEYRMF